MEYRAVRNRCAVDLNSFDLPISRGEALAILAGKGFRIIEVDLVALARECIGKSRYWRGARPSQAPAVVDCSSFMKWLYGERGIWLPRLSIEQRAFGEAVNLSDIIAGDLIFVSGARDYYLNDPADGVGHVGMASGGGTVIHAANIKAGVIETSLEKFADKADFRGAGRYIPGGREVLTLETPIEREIETADHIKWIIRRSLPEAEKT